MTVVHFDGMAGERIGVSTLGRLTSVSHHLRAKRSAFLGPREYSRRSTPSSQASPLDVWSTAHSNGPARFVRRERRRVVEGRHRREGERDGGRHAPHNDTDFTKKQKANASRHHELLALTQPPTSRGSDRSLRFASRPPPSPNDSHTCRLAEVSALKLRSPSQGLASPPPPRPHPHPPPSWAPPLPRGPSEKKSSSSSAAPTSKKQTKNT